MVLKILADAGQLVHNRNAVPLQHETLADSRQFEDLRRGDRARGEDHLRIASRRAAHAMLEILDADRALALEQHLVA